MDHYDFIVLGGGNAGLAASKRVKAAGKQVALIDPTPIGGLCPLRGCNPKKVLVRAAEVLHVVKDAGEHGVRTGQVSVDWNAVIDRKHGFTDGVTESTEKGLGDAGIEYIRIPPRFVSPDSLRVENRTLTFDHALIATGSAPRRLSFPGADLTLTSDDILELREVPRRLAIIGSGVVAFEFASVFVRLGSDVDMLMRGRGALGRADADLAARVVAHLRTLGFTLHEDVEVQGIDRRDNAYDVKLNNGNSIGADVVLNATGRPPQLEPLELAAANVEYSEKGVKVDQYLRSVSNRRIFAAGDAHGRMALSPVATYEGNVVAQNILEGDVKRAEYDAIPSVVFTIPPLAAVGMTEDEARKQGHEVEVITEDMSGWTVFRIAAEKPAHGKAIFEKRTGRLLGAHIFGPGADENIHLFALAMRFGLSRNQLAQMIYAYPTFGSAVGYLTPAAE
jgi:glutathione reductase (NADPH)